MILTLSLLETQVEYALENHELFLAGGLRLSGCARNSTIITTCSRCWPKKIPAVRSLRLALVLLFKNKVEKLLRTMGISVSRENVRRSRMIQVEHLSKKFASRAGGQRYLIFR